MASGKHLDKSKREVIENMLAENKPIKEIAQAVGCCPKTIYNEIKRGKINRKNGKYSAKKGEEQYQKNRKKVGRKPKILKDKKLLKLVGYLLGEQRYSPEAIVNKINCQMEKKFKETITSCNTLYSAVKNGYIKGITMKTLPRKDKQKKKKIVKTEKKPFIPAGDSIELRTKEINQRTTIGHWEMDTVKGIKAKDKCLLVLTERFTRFEIIEVMKDCSSNEVRKALNRLEKRFGSKFYDVFKTITVDNGVEFRRAKELEKALYRVGNRTKIYYCHPYSPQERGSNENCNILIRRWLPKGVSLASVTKNKAYDIQCWINLYPRNIFNGLSSYDFLRQQDNDICKALLELA